MSKAGPNLDRAARAFRLLLRLLTPALRSESGEEMTQLFLLRLARARRDGRGAVIGLWCRTCVDICRTAVAERWEESNQGG